ncbi:orotidine 5'-phosphate decarboxylase [Anoxybacillus rupiensis]|uniref:3-hexulose-6-phosphate synthase n=1 Tax=Anoxybacteroides rupiense TaxID=311460 RepID=UPI001BA6D57F|nr:3-hexulose-6-phosphate synthase [Anoxybacillus rupiensis]MBS2772631.1 orotidine 5'-phosphate decarboxylase [Anoxybacillus rupiensis]
MYIQLALDRMTMDEAIHVTEEVYHEIDWIEVGTSLIKEYGVQSIERLKKEFPNKLLVADMKTMDNAAYECQMCFEAGADVMTAMGVAPNITVKTCLDEAKKRKKRVMIDLLNVHETLLPSLLEYKEAIFCLHVSKDEQELFGFNAARFPMFLEEMQGRTWAIAGGISLDSLDMVKQLQPYVVIIGSAITKAENKQKVAQTLKQAIFARRSHG